MAHGSDGKRSKERAWDVYYDLQLRGRDVRRHAEVEALKKRFETDIPQR